MKNNPPEASSRELEISNFIDSDTREFVLEEPQVLDEALERLEESLSHPDTEPGLTSLVFILRRFENSAGKFQTRDNLWKYFKNNHLGDDIEFNVGHYGIYMIIREL